MAHCFRNGEETNGKVVGNITGKIPSWLVGELLRIGPGIHQIGSQRYNYILDGLAMLHKICIEKDQVTYQSKYLESETYKLNMQAKRIVVSEFRTHSFPDPCGSIFSSFKTEAKFILFGDDSSLTDNTNVNLASHGDQLYALSDGTAVRQIDAKSLRTLGSRINIKDYASINTSTAHPHFLSDGSAIYAGSNYRSLSGPHYCFLKVPRSHQSKDLNVSTETCFADGKIIAEIPCRWRLNPSYFHSFGITATDKLVFIESPFCMSVSELLKFKTMKQSFLSLMKWWIDEPTRFYVIDLQKRGSIHPIQYETKNLFVFHHINAYEQNGAVVVDVIGYENPKDVLEYFEHSKLKKNCNTKAAFHTSRRFVLPLQSNRKISETQVVQVAGTKLTDNYLELPRINYSLVNGKPYRYFYAIGTLSNKSVMELGRFICKVDVESRTRKEYHMGDSLQAGEPVFVQNPTLTNPAEDDGLVLSLVLSTDNPTFLQLLILDASTMEKVSFVDFSTDGPIASSLHGIWINAADT